MADDDDRNGEAADSEDRPDDRADEFFESLGVPASGYSLTLAQALDHFRAADADGAARGWVSLGPRNVGGAVRCLAQHPWLPNVFFAGSAQGGLWKSEDSGYSWRQAGAPGLPPVSIGAITIAPSNPQIMYVGTGEPMVDHPGGAGLYKSEDGGVSFSRMVGTGHEDGAADHYPRIVVDPFEPDRFWAASSRGLWRHDPGLSGGFTLEKVSSANPGDNVTDVALARVPDDLDKYVLLAGVATVGIFRAVVSRSSSGSADWIKAVDAGAAIALPIAGKFGRIRLAFSGRKVGIADKPFAYAVMEDLGWMGDLGEPGFEHPVPPKDRFNRLKFPTYVYRSEDFGVSWKADAGSMPIAVPPPDNNKDGQAWYSLAIAVAPDDPEIVVMGYVELYRSRDRGKTFVQILDGSRWRQSVETEDRAQHGDQHAIVFDLRSPRSLWVCNDGGISFTADYLTAANPAANPIVQWRKRSYGIGAAQLTAIATHPRFPFMCGGGMQDNGTFVSYGGPTWYQLDGGDGGQMAFDPVDPRQFFTSTQENVAQIGVAVPGPLIFSWKLPDAVPPGRMEVN